MKPNRYYRIIETIFKEKYTEDAEVILFQRDEFIGVANRLGISVPKNLGDVIYSFKYRKSLPDSIRPTAPEGKEWVIISQGRATYAFELRTDPIIVPDTMLVHTKILDATPGIVARYSLNDEQALLTRIRYNRLIDIFTGITCYSLQNHLRTTVPNIGQIETDELYVGVDKRGVHYIFPVQAKGGNDKLGVVQIEQDIALCEHRFPNLECRAIAAQFMADNIIALFELAIVDNDVRKVAEKHYQLVFSGSLSELELQEYKQRLDI